MKKEMYMARRLRLSSDGTSSTSTILNIALAGMTIAVVIMFLSIAIVTGFRSEITSKIYSLGPHVKVSLQPDYTTHRPRPIDFNSYSSIIGAGNEVLCVEPIIEKEALIKTDNDYKGIGIRGLSASADTSFMAQHLIEGHMPSLSDSITTEIAISRHVAAQLQLGIGDRVFAYFIDDNVKVRRLTVSGIFNTDFDDFDNATAIGNIAMLRQVNGWADSECSYIAATLLHPENSTPTAYDIYSQLVHQGIADKSSDTFRVADIYNENITYFAWLDLLDANIVIILILMAFVAGFTIVAGMLIIILDKISTIGILKTLGVGNSSVRITFIFLAEKLIVRALIIGNAISIALALLQKHFHIVHLDPESYYMSFVPIELNWWYISALNLGVIVFAMLALVIPSYIISRLEPSQSMRYE